jgi:anaerobic magnesium-protoporphyrin IX monomethyl ester cyclase
MKILLVRPDGREFIPAFSALWRPEPLALELLAATVPDHEVRILDLRVETTPLERYLASFQPDLVGVTGSTTDVPRMLEICETTKSCLPDAVTVVGGYHATLLPSDFNRDSADIIVCGEGEITFRELVTALEGKEGLGKVDGIIYRHQKRQVVTPPPVSKSPY